MTWQRTGVAGPTLLRGGMREVMVGSTSVVLLRLAQRVVAVEAVCPHLGGLLADGQLAGSRLTCPVHGAVFEVTDGSVLADPFGVEPPVGAVDSLRTFPAREEDGMIEVDLP